MRLRAGATKFLLPRLSLSHASNALDDRGRSFVASGPAHEAVAESEIVLTTPLLGWAQAVEANRAGNYSQMRSRGYRAIILLDAQSRHKGMHRPEASDILAVGGGPGALGDRREARKGDAIEQPAVTGSLAP